VLYNINNQQLANLENSQAKAVYFPVRFYGSAGKSGEQSSQGSLLSGALLWVSVHLVMQLGTMQASGQTLSLSMTK